jgi:hypothetical protein
MKAAMKIIEETLDDEYEIWKRQPVLAENDNQSLNPIKYWQAHQNQFPVLSQLALDIYAIPASAADCERTFSELSDLLGTRRPCMKPELLAALQSLRSWKRIGIRRPTTSGRQPPYEHTVDELSKIQQRLYQFDL